jgi:hypothetical protein
LAEEKLPKVCEPDERDLRLAEYEVERPATADVRRVRVAGE